jgi:hypothetical protein
MVQGFLGPRCVTQQFFISSGCHETQLGLLRGIWLVVGVV